MPAQNLLVQGESHGNYYLASSVQEEPDKHFVGYLTVFDGRRGKTSNQYERQEINYRSEYSSHPSMNYRRFYMAECV